MLLRIHVKYFHVTLTEVTELGEKTDQSTTSKPSTTVEPAHGRDYNIVHYVLASAAGLIILVAVIIVIYCFIKRRYLKWQQQSQVETVLETDISLHQQEIQPSYKDSDKVIGS